MTNMRKRFLVAAAPLLIAIAAAQGQVTQNEDAFLEETFVESTDGDRFVAAAPSWNNLIVHDRNPGGQWVPGYAIDISSDPDRWYWSSDLSGNRLALLFDSNKGSQPSREIDIMALDQGEWSLETRIEINSILGEDWFCGQFDLHGDELVVSCHRHENPVLAEFKLLSFELNGSQWELQGQASLAQSEPVLEDDWILVDASFDYWPSFEDDRMIAVEYVMYERVDGLAIMEFPIFHTFQRNNEGEWILANSMPLPPIAGPGTDIHSTNWVNFDCKGGRLVTAETYTFAGFEYLELYAWSEYNWDEGSSRWIEADDSVLEELGAEYPWPDLVWQVQLLEADRLLVLWQNNGLGPCSEVNEYQRVESGWSKTQVYVDSEPGSCMDFMKATSEHLFIMAIRNKSAGTLFFDTGEAEDDVADVTGDGNVDVSDLLVIIQHWGDADDAYDLDGNGVVDVGDLLIIIQNWGDGAPGFASPGPTTVVPGSGNSLDDQGKKGKRLSTQR